MGSTTVTAMLIVQILLVVSHVPVKMDSLEMDLLVLVSKIDETTSSSKLLTSSVGMWIWE